MASGRPALSYFQEIFTWLPHRGFSCRGGFFAGGRVAQVSDLSHQETRWLAGGPPGGWPPSSHSLKNTLGGPYPALPWPLAAFSPGINETFVDEKQPPGPEPLRSASSNVRVCLAGPLARRHRKKVMGSPSCGTMHRASPSTPACAAVLSLSRAEPAASAKRS